MIFTSTIFLFLFFPIVMGLYFLVPKKIKNIVLLIASLFFYAWGEFQYLYVILVSILINYLVGWGIGKNVERGESRRMARLILFVGVCLNLLLLGYFKYANFLIENFNLLMSRFSLDSIANRPIHLPVGISFFTFQAISYIVDIYRKEVKAQKNLLNVALYIALFPQLMAGPIIRYKTIAWQIEDRKHSLNDIAEGLRRFIRGLGKKMLIANPMADIADVVFGLGASELNVAVTWIGIVCYSFQIFFDFAGYSDMAIGLGRVFGFHFPENFNFPYISKSIKEFWRRWHISLSTWLKDYLYIPLGGNRHGVFNTYRNLLTVFLLCGLWHGASWNFIIWGSYQGFFLVIERMKFGKILEKLPKLLQHIYAIFVTLLGWVFFRSADMTQASVYLSNMFDFSKTSRIPVDLFMLMNNFSYLVFGFAIMLSMPFASWMAKKLQCRTLRQSWKGDSKSNCPQWDSVKRDCVQYEKDYKCSWFWLFVRDLWLILILILSIIRISSSTHNPFIYFKF